MIVTIFSTKAFKSTDLFGGNNICSNSEATKTLNNYYRESIIIRHLIEIEDKQEKKNQLKELIISSFLKNNHNGIFESIFDKNIEEDILGLYKDWSEYQDKLSEENDDAMIKELCNKREQIAKKIKELLSPRLNGEEFLDKCTKVALNFAGFSDNKSRIMREYISMLSDESLELIGVGNKEKHNIYCILSDGKTVPGVYGVQCLQTPDTSNNWISTLIDCAKILPWAANSEDSLSVQLILHDKDLTSIYVDGEYKNFAEKDVYVVSDQEKTILAPNWKEKGISSLSIIFFHHTSNKFAKIVENLYDGEIIYSKIQSFVNDYFNNLKHVKEEDDYLYK